MRQPKPRWLAQGCKVNSNVRNSYIPGLWPPLEYSSIPSSFVTIIVNNLSIFFFKILFLFMRERERGKEQERDKWSLSWEPDMWTDLRTLRSWPELKPSQTLNWATQLPQFEYLYCVPSSVLMLYMPCPYSYIPRPHKVGAVVFIL